MSCTEKKSAIKTNYRKASLSVTLSLLGSAFLRDGAEVDFYKRPDSGELSFPT